MAQRQNVPIAIFFVIAAAALWVTIPHQVMQSWAPIGVGTRFFPRATAVLLGGSALLLLLQAWLRSPNAENTKSAERADIALGSVLSQAGIVFAYLLSVQVAGFLVASAIVLPVYMFVIARRISLLGFIVALAIAAIVYFSFRDLLHVRLPGGILGWSLI